MGREEVGVHTRHVAAWVCWLTYICAILAMVLVFNFPVSTDWYLNAFAADMAATFVVFFFSFVCGNSSLYDPAWYVFPVALSVFWMFAADGQVTLRSIVTFTLVFIWAARFALQ